MGKDPAAVALGRKGGLASAAGRMKKLTAEERSAIASAAAKARWGTAEAKIAPKAKAKRKRGGRK